jgi:hypothetical protein
MPDRSTKPTEIEITLAMIEAGLPHLYRYHPDKGMDDEETVEAIYWTMFSIYASGVR